MSGETDDAPGQVAGDAKPGAAGRSATRLSTAEPSVGGPSAEGPSASAAARSRLHLTGSWVAFVGPALAIGVFVVAIAALHHILRQYHYRDIVQATRSLPRSSLLAALGFTVAAYASLPGYDAVGLAYARHPLPARRVMLASFVAYAMSQNLGFAVLTGGSVRYRFWSA